MSRLRSEHAEELPQTVLQEESPVLTNTNQLDNTSETHPTVNDHQASLRRRAPTRHSIKSLTSRKSPKRGSIKESSKNKRKSNKYPRKQSNSLNETKILYNIPSVSQIAPLPEVQSHGILPVLSLDRRDSSNTAESDDVFSLNTDVSNDHQLVL
ncbi:unnamed protein product [Rotaria magnacalcarata]|uniref:Uncharacterized protein n=1 Tax=Rotaria magnacalcarata TaxID=392030 RepID=A0A8S2K253_9BILA|nr:unnamed protein product [Rotaria magnacalcarata]